MNRTPESSLSATFLFKLWDLNGEQRHLEAGLKAVDAVLEEIVPEGRWEDFETYWSCCQFWNDQVGEKIPRNDQYKQNTLSMFWTAEALLEAYRQTEDEKYLNWGVRTLDELSMYQQIWQPPFIYIPALGGFGVMNFDGEWNDSRESLFAELYLDYYAITGNRDYFERGVAALKSSFVMMYCPENPKQKVQWEKAHPSLAPRIMDSPWKITVMVAKPAPKGWGWEFSPYMIGATARRARPETESTITTGMSISIVKEERHLASIRYR
ncbi:MAG: hypothetical protein H6751_05155 [Candidatus Omnitrophica bacterium]|nr:hypothetical protein [Candidatus Omnitrophota bacterium]